MYVRDVLVVAMRGGILEDGSAKGDLVGLSVQKLVLGRRDGGPEAEAFRNTRVRPIDGPEPAEIWKAFDRT